MEYQPEEDKLDVNRIKFQYESAKNVKQQLIEEQAKNNDLLIDLENDIKVLEDVKTLLETLKNYKMDSKKEFILNTINAALQDVFEQNVRIDIEMNASNKSGASSITTRYDIVLYQNDIEMARNEKLLENNGGGILSFISILFKILVGYIYSNSKFYLFDESISQVSGSYRPRLARFLRKFCEEFGFTIILISHTDDIDEHAHVGYRLQGTFDKTGVPTLSIGDTFGNYPETNYNYVHIKNFQSIAEATFRYKGFCVIRGDNNIGKSASFRAINALLFNTFDTSDFPRINRPRGSNVEIDFGYFKTADDVIENDKNRIKMCYKAGQKIVYEFDGEEYAGKSLAFEKIKDKVETLGFKYVNLKETYKNFKGNLKDQTERLALTTQHDGFYLVGNKSNETEKVFNFLFDSTAVSAAIMNVDNDSRDINNRYQMIKAANDKINIQIKQTDVRIEYYLLLFYAQTIRNYFTNIELQKRLSVRVDKINSIISDINSWLNIAYNLDNYKQYLQIRKDNDILRAHYINNINIIESCKIKLEEVNSLLYYINKIKEYNQLKTTRNYVQYEIDKINNQMNVITKCISLVSEISADKVLCDRLRSYKLLLTNRFNINESITYFQSCVNNVKQFIDIFNTLNSEIESYKFYIVKFREYFGMRHNKEGIDNAVINYTVAVAKIQELISNYNYIQDLRYKINDYKSRLLARDTIESNILYFKNSLNEVETEYRSTVPVCPCCQGTGIDPNHPAHAAKLQEFQWQASTH